MTIDCGRRLREPCAQPLPEAERDSRKSRRFTRRFWTTGEDTFQGQKAQIVQPCKQLDDSSP